MFGIKKEPRKERYSTCAKCEYNHRVLGNLHMCVFKGDGTTIIEPEEMYVSRECMHFAGEWTTDAYKKAVKVPNPGEKENIMYLCPKCHKEIINFISCVSMDNKEVTIGHCDHCNAEFELSKLIEKTTYAFVPPSYPATISGTGSKTSDDVPQKEPVCYTGVIERVKHIRELLTPQEFTGFCIGNVFQHLSLWREDGGISELRNASAYLDLAIENEEKRSDDSNG